MAIATTNTYDGPFFPNGVTTVFPFTFTAVDIGEVAVISRDSDGIETTVSPSDYTVTLTSPSGGDVTFSTAPASGPELYVILNPDFTQEIDFTADEFFSTPTNEGLDRGVSRAQYLKNFLLRSIYFPVGETTDQLPPAADRIAKFLAFDASGDIIMSNGTGADDGLRTDLATVGGGLGAALVAVNTGDTVQDHLDGYSTRTAIKALTSYAGARAFLTESGREGEFVFRSGDYSAEITADTSEGIYLKADDAAATTGAWVRAYDGPANVKWFGAAGDGATNDTTAFTVALAVVDEIFAPAGTYLFNLVITSRAKAIRGEGIRNTIFSPYTATDPVIELDGDTAGTIIDFFTFSDFSITGNAKQGDGLKITNTADTHGCDQLQIRNVRITACAKGFHCAGRSIWNSFENFDCDYNYDGIYVETDQACNVWAFYSCTTRRNDRHGVYMNKTSVTTSGFLDFTFVNFNTEFNGEDTSIATIYGFYAAGFEGLSFHNCHAENNGANLVGVTSYGFHFAGTLGRSLIMDGIWAVSSKYPIYVTGQKKSGVIDNVYRLSAYAGGTGLTIVSNWASDEPKLELGNAINGTITVTSDGNGNSPIIQGVDYYGAAQTTLSLQHRKNVTLNTTAAGSALTSLTGLVSGDEIYLYNYANGGANTITIAAALMANATLYTINPDTGKKFKVSGFPKEGKLVAI